MTMEQSRRLHALERRFDALEAARIADRDALGGIIGALSERVRALEEERSWLEHDGDPIRSQ